MNGERWFQRAGAVLALVGAKLALVPGNSDDGGNGRRRATGVVLVLAGAHLVYHRGIRPRWR